MGLTSNVLSPGFHYLPVLSVTPMKLIVRSLKSHVFTWCIVVTATSLLCGQEPIPPTPHGQAKGEWNDWLKELSPTARRGYEHLIKSPYLPSDFDSDVAYRLAKASWKLAQRNTNTTSTSLLEKESEPTNAQLAEALWDRFGLTSRPELSSAPNESSLDSKPNQLPPPLQYVVNEDGSYVMNCFACHGGKVNGVTYPGAPNNRYALQTLTEEARLLKLQLGKQLTHMDLGSAFLPLGTTRGSSNAVMFGVALMHFRDADLNVIQWRPAPKLVNHDMDPPPWWHFKKKHHLYIDGFAEKGHRGLMQFMLVRQNGPEKFREWEDDFREVFEFISSIPSPKYPGPINPELAEQGKTIFVEHCSNCHGTYGAGGTYPEQLIALEEIGTDPVRYQSLSAEHRKAYGESWFALNGQQETIAEPGGYVAPPLDGVWASAPYFHNGSVPTLWHVMNPEKRPALWKRTIEATDFEKVGLTVDELSELPNKLTTEQRREYFDTRGFGKSAVGHDFPKRLTDAQRTAVLEYLKTL
jgi:mono/diheme cytochrome c family protein